MSSLLRKQDASFRNEQNTMEYGQRKINGFFVVIVPLPLNPHSSKVYKNSRSFHFFGNP
jgi:hypothetical protein